MPLTLLCIATYRKGEDFLLTETVERSHGRWLSCREWDLVQPRRGGIIVHGGRGGSGPPDNPRVASAAGAFGTG